MKNLNIPTKYRRTGMYIYCNRCKTHSTIADGVLKKTTSCSHPPEKQVFKIKVHVPATKNGSRTKVLKTRDIKEAEKKRLEFIKLLEDNGYQLKAIDSSIDQNVDKYSLLYQMSRFIDFITKGGFYEFEAPKRLEIATIKDYKRNFKYFLKSQAKKNNIKTLSIEGIGMANIELFHKFIKTKTNSTKTYNNIMSSLRSFYNHLIKYEKFKLDNPFEHVPVQTVTYNPLTFTDDEFSKVLSVTTFENGKDFIKKRNFYRDWLPTAFKLGLYSCLRLDELVHLKYSDIVSKDNCTFIKVGNIKANKLLGTQNGINKRYKMIPLIKQMEEVLIKECDYQNSQGKDKYILDNALTRVTVYNIIQKGFTHFKRIANIEEGKCFKELRKTFINHLKAQYGNETTSIVSDHSGTEILDKHYFNKLEAVKKTADLVIFSDI